MVVGPLAKFFKDQPTCVCPVARRYRAFDHFPRQLLPCAQHFFPTVLLRKKERARLISQSGSYLCRQRPTLPHTFACSTIGPAGLNFRVRDGNGWIPRGKITDKLRRIAGANESRTGTKWEPAAEVLRLRPLQPRDLAAPSRCRVFSDELFKDHENDVSQLNRLRRSRGV
jgi:hypothetical protein